MYRAAMSNPVNTLRNPTRRAPWIVGGIASAAVIVAAITVGPSFAANLNPTAAPTPTMTPYVSTLTPAELGSVEHGANEQQATIAADKAAQAAANAAAAKAPHHNSSTSGPVRCPAGTVANAVDGAGNESNCQPTQDGKTCQAYNDSNVCTAWGALDVKPLKP